MEWRSSKASRARHARQTTKQRREWGDEVKQRRMSSAAGTNCPPMWFLCALWRHLPPPVSVRGKR
ncbi:unnamed protein product [Ectocarpus sp. 12 AP-2014]